MTSDTTALAEFTASLTPDALPPTVRALIRQHTLDVCAGVFAGADIAEARSVAGMLGGNEAATAGKFAMVAHAAESDPIHAATTLCAGLIAVPPALLLSPDGATAMAAVAAGYETAIRIGEALGSGRLLGLGWWPTAVIGGAGAAAAAARALGLDAETTRHAVGLALVQAGGLGTGAAEAPESRNLLAAGAIRTGVEAAVAAAAGLRGPSAPLTGDRPFLGAFGGEPAPERLLAGLGSDWKIAATSLKPYACALQAQSALAALAEIVATNRLTAANILAVRISLPDAMRRIVDRPGLPRSRFAAAANLRFLAAALLIDGDILPARFSDDARRGPDLEKTMDRVTIAHDAALDARYPTAWPARVAVETADGSIDGAADNPPGHPSRPLDASATERRFRAFSENRLSDSERTAFIGAVNRLEELPGLGRVTGPVLAAL